MIILLRHLLLFSLLLLFPAPAEAAEQCGKVSWIYDGDTLRVENIGKVRLLGIDTPETEDSSRDRYYLKAFGIPPKQLRQIARQAKQFNIRQVKGKRVCLEFDRQAEDKYGRILAYLQLPDGRSLNRLLLEKGLASVFRRYPFRNKEDFLTAEKNARGAQLGLWQP
ncbi:MAG: hypothetical protein GQ578_05130 [Desulfuromonadaceae bacterium]|nr:hypothetical protein [Desulfuromonadaceae bacterium]